MQRTAYVFRRLAGTGTPNSGSGSCYDLARHKLAAKLTVFLLIAFLGAQAQSVTFTAKEYPLKNVFAVIKKQTGYVVFGKDDLFKESKPVSISVTNMPLTEFLSKVMEGQPLNFRIDGKNIILSHKPPSLPGRSARATALDTLPATAAVDILGHVFSEEDRPIGGATVTVKETKRSTLTNQKGDVLLERVTVVPTLVITSIGYEPKEIRLKPGQTEFNVRLKIKVNELGGVEVNNGMFTRKKESFTGAATTYTGDQLKTIGNRNVLESLKTLDPSFIIVPNNQSGSDPNHLPQIEVRGKTTITNTDLNNQFSSDPNQPLFILDGFESTLQAVYDLDMNRVASITILKDAASTALYGAKASNGVIVVETKRPVPGELRVSYTGDFSADIVDLSSYNLMNATQKLQFEKLSGVYTPSLLNGNDQWGLNQLYNNRLTQVQSGVNTYWLNEPVHLGFTNRHSVQLAGGNQELMFTGGASYGTQDGVMKGSDRSNWSGNVDVTYRKGKVNITDIVQLSGNTSNASPYGSFTSYATANPYYRKRNSDGTIPEYLDSNDVTMVNPLYNASLFSINQTKYSFFSNSLQGIFTLSNHFRITAGGMLSQGNTQQIAFTPPENTQYINVDAHQKGSYNNSTSRNTNYSGNLMLTYATILGKNRFTANVRSDIQQNSGTSVGFSATGFPYGTDGNPSFAYSYTPYTLPTSSTTVGRDVGFLGSINYTYDQRFLLDAVYRLDGTSVFGSNKLWKPFASAGLGWNLNREPFLRQLHWIDLLKIRGNIGFTGNENLGQFTSLSTYSYQPGVNNFGQGLTLASLGNPNLEWQKTLQGSYGMDFTLLHNRISGYLEYFDKVTNPLVITANGALPSSAGLNSGYELNAGELTTKGLDFNLRVSPIYDLRKRIIWTIGLTGQAYKSRYSGFGNKLQALNKQEQDANGLIRYTDGYSPDDIWAVVSKGIDPATGNELFLKKDGTTTFQYDPDDIARVGNTEPKVEGVISSTMAYKNFTLGVNFRYRLGGDVFNTDLYNKVENITLGNVRLNQDKRALFDRWQKPGDISQFKSIANTSATPMSSRFVEKDNQIIGESFNLGYRISNGWIRKMRMQSLSFNFYLNDLFWLESVKTERGTDYPFARTTSFSINASF
jgi:TonB-linked SusC/RagA family outer membrane protein